MKMLYPTAITLLLFAPTVRALPKVGETAPSLHAERLLHAPSGTRLNLASLRGKTVALDFWATWCGPCVASIPHWNQLTAAIDPSQVTFIAINDESPDVVKSFLAKTPFSGWLALDPKGVTSKAFGVEALPVTIVIDRSGRVALVTTTESFTLPELMRIANMPTETPKKLDKRKS